MTTTWTETDALAPKGPSLAALMLARGAQLAGPAAAVAEQTEDVAAEVEVATCTHAACLNAAHDECECACGGIGHGAATQVRATATRAKTQASIDARGGIMAVLGRVGGLAPADEPW